MHDIINSNMCLLPNLNFNLKYFTLHYGSVIDKFNNKLYQCFKKMLKNYWKLRKSYQYKMTVNSIKKYLPLRNLQLPSSVAQSNNNQLEVN